MLISWIVLAGCAIAPPVARVSSYPVTVRDRDESGHGGGGDGLGAETDVEFRVRIAVSRRLRIV